MDRRIWRKQGGGVLSHKRFEGERGKTLRSRCTDEIVPYAIEGVKGFDGTSEKMLGQLDN